MHKSMDYAAKIEKDHSAFPAGLSPPVNQKTDIPENNGSGS